MNTYNFQDIQFDIFPQDGKEKEIDGNEININPQWPIWVTEGIEDSFLLFLIGFRG